MSTPIVNKVKSSSLQTIKLEDFVPEESSLIEFDLKNFLFMEMVLKEKEFRLTLKEHDWSVYEGKNVALFCSTDALIPTWAFMLVSSYLLEVSSSILNGNLTSARTQLSIAKLESTDFNYLSNAKLVVKGCGAVELDQSIFIKITTILKPIVSSLMFGEPCSTVPIYKRKK